MKIILYFFLIFSLLITGCSSPEEIIPRQMIQAELAFVRDIQPLIRDISVSFTAYFTYDKSKTDFLNDVEGFKERYYEHASRRERFNAEHLVKNPSPPLAAAIAGIDGAKTALLTILNKADAQSREELLYIYLTQMQTMQKNIEMFEENALLVIP